MNNSTFHSDAGGKFRFRTSFGPRLFDPDTKRQKTTSKSGNYSTGETTNYSLAVPPITPPSSFSRAPLQDMSRGRQIHQSPKSTVEDTGADADSWMAIRSSGSSFKPHPTTKAVRRIQPTLVDSASGNTRELDASSAQRQTLNAGATHFPPHDAKAVRRIQPTIVESASGNTREMDASSVQRQTLSAGATQASSHNAEPVRRIQPTVVESTSAKLNPLFMERPHLRDDRGVLADAEKARVHALEAFSVESVTANGLYPPLNANRQQNPWDAEHESTRRGFETDGLKRYNKTIREIETRAIHRGDYRADPDDFLFSIGDEDVIMRPRVQLWNGCQTALKTTIFSTVDEVRVGPSVSEGVETIDSRPDNPLFLAHVHPMVANALKPFQYPTGLFTSSKQLRVHPGSVVSDEDIRRMRLHLSPHMDHEYNWLADTDLRSEEILSVCDMHETLPAVSVVTRSGRHRTLLAGSLLDHGALKAYIDAHPRYTAAMAFNFAGPQDSDTKKWPVWCCHNLRQVYWFSTRELPARNYMNVTWRAVQAYLEIQRQPVDHGFIGGGNVPHTDSIVFEIAADYTESWRTIEDETNEQRINAWKQLRLGNDGIEYNLSGEDDDSVSHNSTLYGSVSYDSDMENEYTGIVYGIRSEANQDQLVDWVNSANWTDSLALADSQSNWPQGGTATTATPAATGTSGGGELSAGCAAASPAVASSDGAAECVSGHSDGRSYSRTWNLETMIVPPDALRTLHDGNHLHVSVVRWMALYAREASYVRNNERKLGIITLLDDDDKECKPRLLEKFDELCVLLYLSPNNAEKKRLIMLYIRARENTYFVVDGRKKLKEGIKPKFPKELKTIVRKLNLHGFHKEYMPCVRMAEGKQPCVPEKCDDSMLTLYHMWQIVMERNVDNKLDNKSSNTSNDCTFTLKTVGRSWVQFMRQVLYTLIVNGPRNNAQAPPDEPQLRCSRSLESRNSELGEVPMDVVDILHLSGDQPVAHSFGWDSLIQELVGPEKPSDVWKHTTEGVPVQYDALMSLLPKHTIDEDLFVWLMSTWGSTNEVRLVPPVVTDLMLRAMELPNERRELQENKKYTFFVTSDGSIAKYCPYSNTVCVWITNDTRRSEEASWYRLADLLQCNHPRLAPGPSDEDFGVSSTLAVYVLYEVMRGHGQGLNEHSTLFGKPVVDQSQYIRLAIWNAVKLSREAATILDSEEKPAERPPPSPVLLSDDSTEDELVEQPPPQLFGDGGVLLSDDSTEDEPMPQPPRPPVGGREVLLSDDSTEDGPMPQPPTAPVGGRSTVTQQISFLHQLENAVVDLT